MSEKQLTSAQKLRKDKVYYGKELQDNAKRGREIYHKDPVRIAKNITRTKARLDRVGYYPPSRWSEEEESYLVESYKNKTVEYMCGELGRSYSSVTHKVNRLFLTKYNKYE